ncbi:MAG TPA: PQQ-binding-like beta-propeller repeat protein, partial [Nocardioidaceae bacterium]|nr:PQQ-binding-like beta-propeller repeat protein [Nocardioidaceae bacterium]
IADGWVYTNHGNGVNRYALASGTAGWAVLAGQDIYRIEAADADTVYVWEAVFDFGSPFPSILHALNTTDGSQRWQADVPSRIGSLAVTGDVVWLTSTGIFSQEHASDLIALDRSTGQQVRAIAYDDNIYGWTDVAFGAGKVVLTQGGSSGDPVPRQLRVLGLGGPIPAIADKVLPMGRVATAYSVQLATTSLGPVVWSIQGGALPSGLSLSAAGLISGTPTNAQSAQVTIRATGGNARFAERSFPVLVVGTPAEGWFTTGRDATRNGFEPGTGVLDLSAAPTFAFRWKTAAPGATAHGGDQDVVASGNRMYNIAWDGILRAWDTTGNTANRLPVWDETPPLADYLGPPTLAGDRLIVFDTSGPSLHAVRASDGQHLWGPTAPIQFGSGYDAPLVVGSAVFVRGLNNAIQGFSTVDGSPLWGGAVTTVTKFYWPLSSDGTRIYGEADCVLYAINVSNGAIAWQTPIAQESSGCGSVFVNQGAPLVVGGKVYASEPAARIVVNAVTGSPLLRIPGTGGSGGSSVLVGGVWVFPHNDRMAAVDSTTGALLWISKDPVGARPLVAATGDFIVVRTAFEIRGISRITGETVWEGGSLAQVGGSPAILGNRIFAVDVDGVRAFGPL